MSSRPKRPRPKVEIVRASFDRSILVLTSLANGPKHGYALIQDIESFSGVRMGPGTLYGCVAKLERTGLVEALPPEDRRQPYRITPAGVAALRDRLVESARISTVGLARLATP
jgi:DNA-binding PadR family transcriptional regulator